MIKGVRRERRKREGGRTIGGGKRFIRGQYVSPCSLLHYVEREKHRSRRGSSPVLGWLTGLVTRLNWHGYFISRPPPERRVDPTYDPPEISKYNHQETGIRRASSKGIVVVVVDVVSCSF